MGAGLQRLDASELGHGLVQFWGVCGVAALLGNGLRRVVPVALEPLRSGEALSSWFWMSYVGFSALMAYVEGYRGFHCKFSPNVVARSQTLRHASAGLRGRLLAPMYCMELIGAPTASIASSWSSVLSVALVVAGVKRFPCQVRAVVDAGVCTGLGLGIVSLFYHYTRLVILDVQPSPEFAHDGSSVVSTFCPVTNLSNLIDGTFGFAVRSVFGKEKADEPPAGAGNDLSSAASSNIDPSGFMAGKRLTVSIQETSKPSASWLWQLCPLNWEHQTLYRTAALLLMSSAVPCYLGVSYGRITVT